LKAELILIRPERNTAVIARVGAPIFVDISSMLYLFM